MQRARRGSKGVPREVREQEILDAAAHEFGTLGHAATSIAAVAERAGISKPLIYDYFGSKDGLYVACCRRAGTRVVGSIDAAMSSWGDAAVDRGAGVLAAIFTALDGRPHDWNVIFDASLKPGGGPHETAMSYRRELIAQAARGIGASYGSRLDDQQDRSALVYVWTATVGAFVEWWLQHPTTSAGEMTDRSARVLRALQQP